MHTPAANTVLGGHHNLVGGAMEAHQNRRWRRGGRKGDICKEGMMVISFQ